MIIADALMLKTPIVVTIPVPTRRSLVSMDAKRRQAGRMRDRRDRRPTDARAKRREME
jgi:hypothetical protein